MFAYFYGTWAWNFLSYNFLPCSIRARFTIHIHNWVANLSKMESMRMISYATTKLLATIFISHLLHTSCLVVMHSMQKWGFTIAGFCDNAMCISLSPWRDRMNLGRKQLLRRSLRPNSAHHTFAWGQWYIICAKEERTWELVPRKLGTSNSSLGIKISYIIHIPAV